MDLLLYGLQRSGTKFLEAAISAQYGVRILNENNDRASARQKHARLYADKRIIPEPQYLNDLVATDLQTFEGLIGCKADAYVVISKDPYSWLLSYRAWARMCNWPEPGHHYIQEYNLFYRSFLTLAKESSRFHFVRFIDLLRDRQGTLASLARRIGLRPRRLPRLLNFRLRRLAKTDSFTARKADFYLQGRYFDRYTSQELAEVNGVLDPAVVAELGYSVRRVVAA